jgi:rhamnulokinase
LTEAPAYAAIDLGASTGRVVAGRLDGGRIELEVLQRFSNRPVRLPDALHWNLLALFAEALEGLRHARALRGIGFDTWGCDYGLLDANGRMLGLPYHYRDARTEGMIARAFERVPAAELYAATGIQTLPINTVFQLLADEGAPALEHAERIALVPDLLAYWLSGELVNESSAASTTGLLDARTGGWATGVIARLGLPARPFGIVADPGTLLGPALPHHELGDVPVYSVAGHDTASAFAAAPIRDEGAAILATGTWCLLGVELAEPVLTDAAREANLTNERGVDGTIRLLRNLMGLWLEQECARVWGMAFPEMHRLAAEAPEDVPVFDPDLDELFAPGDMPARIAKACREAGQREPRDRGEVVRSIALSLACKYRWVLERLEAVTGRDIRTVHVIGGGARHELLCRLTAELTGREVLVGPIEATAFGNVLVQARAAGELGSLADMRAVAAASAELVRHEPPGDGARAEETYARFLEATGLATSTAA